MSDLGFAVVAWSGIAIVGVFLIWLWAATHRFERLKHHHPDLVAVEVRPPYDVDLIFENGTRMGLREFEPKSDTKRILDSYLRY